MIHTETIQQPEIAEEIVKKSPRSVMDMTSEEYVLHTTVRRNNRLVSPDPEGLEQAARLFWQADRQSFHGQPFYPVEHSIAPAVDDQGVYEQQRGTYMGIYIMQQTWAHGERDKAHFENIRPEYRYTYVETMARRDKAVQDLTSLRGAGELLASDMTGMPLEDILTEAEELFQQYPAAAFMARHYEAMGFSNVESAVHLFGAYNGTAGVDAQDLATRVVADMMSRGVINEDDHDVIVTTLNGYTEAEMLEQLETMKQQSLFGEYVIWMQNYLPEWGFDSVDELVGFVNEAKSVTGRDAFTQEKKVIKDAMSSFTQRSDTQPQTAVELYCYMHHLAQRKDNPEETWQEMLNKMGIPDSIPMLDLTQMEDIPHWMLRKLGMHFTHMNETYIRFGHRRHQLELFSELSSAVTPEGLRDIMIAVADRVIA